MSEILTSLAAALPLASGWSIHSLWMQRRIASARRDPLTGLLNRDTFEERASKFLNGGPLAVYFVDLDRFKQTNDTYGHAAGDSVIRATGHRIQEWATENGGLAARLGGDEFVAVTSVYSAGEFDWALYDLSDRLERPVAFEGTQLGVAASIGTIRIDPRTELADLSALLRRADEEMYKAKQTEAGWSVALSVAPTLGTVNGRRAGRRGTAGGTGAGA
ncbi:GGDEF domain-containing protein [Streptomyces sp. NPDC052811]|uniref:GGDEF domain-containing protein n=1 Tax=Streptomyces sp. NPDC052811 TaxID=3155731 RepID=UPI003426EB59